MYMHLASAPRYGCARRRSPSRGPRQHRYQRKHASRPHCFPRI
jgi:hypothetical protein